MIVNSIVSADILKNKTNNKMQNDIPTLYRKISQNQSRNKATLFCETVHKYATDNHLSDLSTSAENFKGLVGLMEETNIRNMQLCVDDLFKNYQDTQKISIKEKDTFLNEVCGFLKNIVNSFRK